jgi:putative hydrolase of the HAD superfamily
MLPKGILLDLDDTILAYSVVAEPIWKQLCQEYACRLNSIQPDRLYGGIKRMSDWFWSDKERHKKGRQDLNSARRFTVSLAFRELKLENLSLAEEMADRFSAQREKEIFFFEKAEETLEILTSQNISLALMTNGEAKKQRNKVQRFNLERFFKSILIEGEIGFGKPEEEVYKRAMRELALGPEEVWAVGDNLEFDVYGPQRLGIFGIWNDFSRQGLPSGSEVTPDRIIHSISELLEECLK